MTIAPQDLFAEAREKYTVADLWLMFRLPGEPKRACRSPFREEKTPSFSIFADGKGWHDHGTGDGGDVIEFIRHAIGGDHKDVREWLKERLGIDYHDYHAAPKPVQKIAPVSKVISWPGKLVEGTEETWKAFANHRKLTFPAVHAMVHAGILRFIKLPNGTECYVITDLANRAAEIRRLDGKPFGESKAYHLSGVDKSWLPGLELLNRAQKETAVLITEGATDLLSAIDLYSRYRREHAGRQLWQPIALLGAGCKALHPEAAKLIRGRRVRIIPDADHAGVVMEEHWTALLRKIGCTVDVVSLPAGTDLTNNISTIQPLELFSL